MNLNKIAVAGALLACTAPVVAQTFPVIPYARTFDLLLAERGAENVYRLVDLNQDGDYSDPGEVVLYYDDVAAGDVLGTVTSICCALDGTAYVTDSTNDIVLALLDKNGDGDALDPGESWDFFSTAANQSGIELGSPQAIATDVLGRWFVLTANGGNPVVGNDCVLQLEDLNGDGDANDAGEASIYCLIPGSTGSVAHSVPTKFALGFDGSIYYGDIGSNGSIAKGIYRIHDDNVDGDANDLGEVTLWWTPPFGNAAWYGMAFDFAGNFYVSNHSTNATVPRSIWRAFDTDNNGTIDPSEQVQVYNTTGAITSGIWWDMARRDDGALLLIDATPDQLLQLVDLTADDDFDDAGESTVVFDKNVAGLPGLDLRGLAFLSTGSLIMNPAVVQLGNPTSFVVRTPMPVNFVIPCASLSFIAPVPVAPFGYLELDPGILITFGIGISDTAGFYSQPLTLPNDPSMIGSYACQAVTGDLYRLYLTNGAPFTITP
jgi:hypothetical protein